MVLRRWLQGSCLQIESDMVPSSTPGIQHTRRQTKRLHKKELKAGMNSQPNFHITIKIILHSINSTNHKAVKVGANETEALETFEPNEMLDMNEASEYEQHSPYEYQPEETFEPAEIQSPLEAYSSHGSSSGVLRYVLLLAFSQAARATSFGRTDFCSIDDAPLESNDADDLLHFFGFVATVTCMFGL